MQSMFVTTLVKKIYIGLSIGILCIISGIIFLIFSIHGNRHDHLTNQGSGKKSIQKVLVNSPVIPSTMVISPTPTSTHTFTPTPLPTQAPSVTNTPTPINTPTPVTENTNHISVSVAGGTNFSINIKNGANHCDVLRLALDEEKISSLLMKYSDTYQTDAVYQINGKGSATEVGWVYTINSKMVPYGCSKAVVHDGENVEWKYVGAN